MTSSKFCVVLCVDLSRLRACASQLLLRTLLWPNASLCTPEVSAHELSGAVLPAGEIANFVAPHTRNVVPSVRCAATSALGAVLLVPEVQAAMAASAGTWVLQRLNAAAAVRIRPVCVCHPPCMYGYLLPCLYGINCVSCRSHAGTALSRGKGQPYCCC